MRTRWIKMAAGVLLAAACSGCFLRDLRLVPIRPPWGQKPREYTLLTTGYCDCGICCNWKRNWLGRPVVASGPNKGKHKRVGITASGKRAHLGTIAADTRIFPFGTVMYIPGYGYGRVEDRGGDIKGRHIDLYFMTHSRAMRWGRVMKKVKVWKPRQAR